MRTFIARPAAGAVVASGSVAHIGTRSAMVNNVGLLCLIIDSGEGSAVSGRVRLQKAAYFCQYLGWPLRDYRLHYCGPYSQTLAETVVDAESACPGPAPPDMRAAAGAGRRAKPRGASPFPPRSCAAGGGEERPPLTPLVAMRAGGGIAAAADRKEGLPGRAGREVAKCLLDAGGRLCLSLPGDGPAARSILDSIGPSGPAWKMSDLVEAMHEECHSDMPVDGIPVAAAARGPEICDSCIRDGQIDLYANNGAAAAHGDYAAHVCAGALQKASMRAACPAARPPRTCTCRRAAQPRRSTAREGATSTALTWQRSGRPAAGAAQPRPGARPARSAR